MITNLPVLPLLFSKLYFNSFKQFQIFRLRNGKLRAHLSPSRHPKKESKYFCMFLVDILITKCKFQTNLLTNWTFFNCQNVFGEFKISINGTILCLMVEILIAIARAYFCQGNSPLYCQFLTDILERSFSRKIFKLFALNIRGTSF